MFKLANKLGQTKPRYQLACFNKKTPKTHITWAFFPKEETKAKHWRALADVPTTPGPPAPRPRSWLRLGLGAAHSPRGRARGSRPSQRAPRSASIPGSPSYTRARTRCGQGSWRRGPGARIHATAHRTPSAHLRRRGPSSHYTSGDRACPAQSTPAGLWGRGQERVR